MKRSSPTLMSDGVTVKIGVSFVVVLPMSGDSERRNGGAFGTPDGS
jgi:hypothetical protein